MNINDEAVESVTTTDTGSATGTGLTAPGLSQPPDKDKRLSPLKTRLESPRADFEFDKEPSGMSVAHIVMNKEWLSLLWQFWLELGKEHIYEVKDYLVELNEVKGRNAMNERVVFVIGQICL